MNKIKIFILSLLALVTGGFIYAAEAPVSVIRDTSGFVRPGVRTDFIKASYFVGTSTSATSTLGGGLQIGGSLKVNGTVFNSRFSNMPVWFRDDADLAADSAEFFYFGEGTIGASDANLKTMGWDVACGCFYFADGDGNPESFEADSIIALGGGFAGTGGNIINLNGSNINTGTILQSVGGTNSSMSGVTANRIIHQDSSNNGFTSSPGFFYTPLSGLTVNGSTTVNFLVATGTATSTFVGGIQTSALDVTGSATSTHAQGIRLAAGCFSILTGCTLSNVVEDLTPQYGGAMDMNGKPLFDATYNPFAFRQASSTYVDLTEPIGNGLAYNRLSEFTNVREFNTGITGGVGVSGALYVPGTDLLFMVDNNSVNVSIYRASNLSGAEFGNITFTGISDPESLTLVSMTNTASGTPDKAIFATAEENTNQIVVFEWDLQDTSGTITKAGSTVIDATNMYAEDATLGSESLAYIPYMKSFFMCKQDASECRIVPYNGSLTPAAFEPFDATTVWSGLTLGRLNDLTYDPSTRTMIAIGDETSVSNTNQDIWRFDPNTGTILEYYQNYVASTSVGVAEGFAQSEGISITPDGETLYVTSEGNEVMALTRGDFNRSSYFNGNVGIGTTTPYARLSVHSRGGNNTDIFVVASSSAGAATSTLFKIDQFGNVGIGSTTPSAKVSIIGATNAPAFEISSSTLSSVLKVDQFGRVGIASGTPQFKLAVSGTVGFNALTAAAGTPNSICQNAVTHEITVNAALTCTVSARDQKNSIDSIDFSALSLIDKLNPVSFKYNDNDRLRYGFIADELESADIHLADAYDENGHARSIDVPALIAVTIKAVQELKAGVMPRSLEENWQWLAIILLGLGLIRQQKIINKLK